VPETAFAAHRDLVGIHPFNDGDGRTARLLMNLVLIRGGYPPMAVRPVDRPAYVAPLQQAQAGQGTAAFDRLLLVRLDATLDEYDVGRIHRRGQAGAAPMMPYPRAHATATRASASMVSTTGIAGAGPAAMPSGISVQPSTTANAPRRASSAAASASGA